MLNTSHNLVGDSEVFQLQEKDNLILWWPYTNPHFFWHLFQIAYIIVFLFFFFFIFFSWWEGGRYLVSVCHNGKIELGRKLTYSTFIVLCLHGYIFPFVYELSALHALPFLEMIIPTSSLLFTCRFKNNRMNPLIYP